MTQEEILIEITKCRDNPYYFATKYLTVLNTSNNEVVRFKTPLTEEEFNIMFRRYENGGKEDKSQLKLEL